MRSIERRLAALEKENSDLRQSNAHLASRIHRADVADIGAVNKDNTRLLKFNGEPGSISFQKWRWLFEAKALSRGWSDDQKRRKLVGYLHDPALATFESFSEDIKISYPLIVQHLSAKYQPYSADMYALFLSTRKQKPAESIMQFSHQLLELAKSAFGVLSDDILNTQVRRYFLHGLEQWLMWETMRRESATYDQAVREAEHL